jgi:hypothetical protein
MVSSFEELGVAESVGMLELAIGVEVSVRMASS